MPPMPPPTMATFIRLAAAVSVTSIAGLDRSLAHGRRMCDRVEKRGQGGGELSRRLHLTSVAHLVLHLVRLHVAPTAHRGVTSPQWAGRRPRSGVGPRPGGSDADAHSGLCAPPKSA